ncbi:MAG: hypothetical protein IJ003_03185 [Candidatus Gastranaerophilales bacterium]|nr:hypothetical protein [Candidatus Gastranaerophilales bacterium]
MNISFTGQLRADDSFFKLKHSDSEKIYSRVKEFYDHPKFTQLLPDTVLYGQGRKNGDWMTINFAGIDIPIQTKGEITVGKVLHQLMYNTCVYNGKIPLSSSPEYVMKALREIIKEKLGIELPNKN